MRGLIANGVSMLAARLVPPVFAFAVHVSIARLGGTEALGSYVHLLAVLMIFQALASAGMQSLLVRELSQSASHQDTPRRGRALGLVSGGVATVGYLAYAAILLPADLQWSAAALASTLLPTAWITVNEATFIAAHRHHRIAVVAVVENSLKMGLAVLALVLGYGLPGVCVAIALARVAGCGAGLIMVGRDGNAALAFTKEGLGGLARAVVPFTLLFVVSMAYFRIDVPIVRAVTGSSATTGVYGAAVTLYLSVLLLPESAMAAAYPRLAASYAATPKGYGEATTLVARLLVLGMTPVALSIIVLADPIVRLVYGEAFADSVAVLRLLALSLPIHTFNSALGQALQAAREQNAMLGIVTGGLALHVVATALFVSRWGIEGAAIALLCSSSAVALAALLVVQRRLSLPSAGWRTVLVALPVAGPLVLAVASPDAWRPIAAVAAAGWICLGAWRSGLVSVTDLLALRSAVRGPQPARSA